MSRVRAILALLTALVLTVGLASSADAAPRKWPKGRITYVDKSLDPDAVKAAVRAWNTSGLNVKFVKVSSTRKARLVIKNTKRVPAGCGTGYGTLGYPGPGRKATVSILHGSDADGQKCAWPGQTLVVAHELGHVLGLEHNSSGCSLMNTSHTNGVAPSLCVGDDIDEVKPGRWRCRLIEKVDLKRAKRIYGGKPRLAETEWCDAIDRIPATGAVTPTQVGGGFTVTVTRAPEPAVPAWLGTWAYGEPGFEVHATPAACTAVPGDDTTQVGLGLWGATPVGGAADEYLQPLPAGPVCLSVWQFDQGYNFALAPTTVLVTGPGARTSARTTDLPPRAASPVAVTRFD
ncbi:matrixin family metalloprotease [Nocardioides glacieisoli]|uniref:Matrixin family metalloprotease n=1 Tax=Nocardioides glacieisoli TaxID=1168730 RepID=A0A4Q2S6P1_9ACTN|nr:M57 family metalloprotease [Nocardioides glacieisoli]RYB96135.1 matrixin family metalloprotease [Nocardioides glacieisoli]